MKEIDLFYRDIFKSVLNNANIINKTKKKYNCKIENCTSLARHKGLCHRHTSQLNKTTRKYKTKEIINGKKKYTYVVRKRYNCKIENCTSLARNKGLCHRHTSELIKSNSNSKL